MGHLLDLDCDIVCCEIWSLKTLVGWKGQDDNGAGKPPAWMAHVLDQAKQHINGMAQPRARATS